MKNRQDILYPSTPPGATSNYNVGERIRSIAPREIVKRKMQKGGTKHDLPEQKRKSHQDQRAEQEEPSRS